ncbi:hypothetical protein CC80DRAFT_395993, partial [Byssothecium circinans]
IAAQASQTPPSSPNNATCQFTPSPNATSQNYPGAPSPSNTNTTTATYPFNLTTLSSVPTADTCYTPSSTSASLLACARLHIDAIDEQLAFLFARRLGYAAVAGNAKFANGSALNDPERNGIVAEGMAVRVLKYGGSGEAGRVLGGEGCMIYAGLEFEVEALRGGCGEDVTERVERGC